MKKTPKKKGIVCTRYAPSPTGELHVGGARTALFNYLYAKKNNGKFILRIEDTDVARNVKDGHIALENNLKQLHIFPDESFSSPGSLGPYMQSQKLGKYRDIANRLVEEGKAYRCFCTDDELEETRKRALENDETPKYSGKCRNLSQEQIDQNLKDNKPFAIRLKVDDVSEYSWEDMVRGEITVPSNSMGDYIIMRSNDLPTYNFAVTIDDIDMKITCVLRGEEHIPNTPYQLATYHALGMEEHIPSFGHLSIIVDESRKKLSKRSGDDRHFVSKLIQKGYVPEAIVNFLALLGWSHGETEIFSQEELVNYFDMDGLSKSPSYFDINKLNWINHKYIQEMSSESYLNYLIPVFTVDLGENKEQKKTFALANKKHIYYGDQLNEMAKEFYKPKKFDDEMKEIIRSQKDLIRLASEHFPEQSEEWNNATIRVYLKQLAQVSGLKGKDFYRPLRVAFSLQMEGFELFNVIECLGRDLARKNLDRSLEVIGHE